MNQKSRHQGDTHAEALDVFETAMAWYEQQIECYSTQLLSEKNEK